MLTNTNTRQDLILAYLKKNVSATVKELAAALYVSDATVRRDLVEMQSIGLLKRSRGGAALLEAADDINAFVRMTENAEEKVAAAAKALEVIPTDFSTVFFDSSSTVLALALRMNLANKTVMVSNLQTALRLAKVKDINLIVPGGNITPTGAVAGSWTNTLLADFHFDLMLASCSSVIGRGAYETSVDTREVKRTAFNRSDCRILIADHTKFGRPGTYLFKNLADFDKIVFDEIDEKHRQALEGLPLFC